MDGVIKLIISFLGGGVIAGLISWARIARSERENRKTEHIKAQVNNLYGPLYFFTSQNVQLLELNRNLMSAYNDEYVDQNWALAPETQKSINEETSTTIDIANTYVKNIIANNQKIVELLQNNSEYIDPEDNDVFHKVVIDNIRDMVEKEESGKLRTPFMVYKSVGDIFFVRQEFNELVINKFLSKNNELKKYH
ncbi:hypothetical protein [Shewanella woodyi]|uniref:Uncharacterized protein n=1 Tax=Shewanella woodyi (strain ATCC 51908 / MS32) TaxID=392500 RepID=B1KR15_SHEWM|nr:hypothetical protein [Shewanella woodyi]ACA84832.1 hypothetical protein Swoo_0536 [Shewanella woodyi ATCC 51908]